MFARTPTLDDPSLQYDSNESRRGGQSLARLWKRAVRPTFLFTAILADEIARAVQYQVRRKGRSCMAVDCMTSLTLESRAPLCGDEIRSDGYSDSIGRVLLAGRSKVLERSNQASVFAQLIEDSSMSSPLRMLIEMVKRHVVSRACDGAHTDA